MDNEQLTNIGDAFANVAGVFAEFRRQSHPSMGGVAPFGLLTECLDREAARISDAGQPALADALGALRSEIEGMNNA